MASENAKNPPQMTTSTGNLEVFPHPANGAFGLHSASNTGSPTVIIGRKGSFGAVNWSQTHVFASDTCFYIDGSCCSENLRWFYWLLQAINLDGFSQDTGVPGLSRSAVYNTYVAKPDQRTQMAISLFLNKEVKKLDEAISKQETIASLTQEKRRAIIFSALTGRDDSLEMIAGQSCLGGAPSGWIEARLGYYAQIQNGSTPSKDEPDYWNDGTVPWVSSAEVNQYVVQKPTELISLKAVQELGLRIVPADTILVGLVGQGRTRGMSARLAFPAAINQNVAAVKPGAALIPQYLHYYLEAAYDVLRASARGGNQAALNCEILRSIRIALPSRTEQLFVVEKLNKKLDQYTAVLTQCRLAASLTKERRAALISSVVTGKIDVRGYASALQEAA